MRPGISAVWCILSLVLVLGCDDTAESPTAPANGAPDAAFLVALGTPLFYQLAVSGFQSCGVATDGAAWCWGDGALAPVRVVGGLTFRQINTDAFHTCGVTTDFHGYCWGENDNGELGDGTTEWRSTPTPVAGGLRFYQINAGESHTCGVSYPDRRGYCWGSNEYGQLGDATLTQRPLPSLVSGGLTFRQVSAGASFTCGVTTGNQAYCWGGNEFGQLGDGSTVQQRKRPGPVAGGLAFRQLEAGTSHSCGVTLTDQAFCWGYGRRGQLGDGKTFLRFTPRAVVGGLSFRRVAPGSGFTCAETPTNNIYCWGSNEYGQLGDGTTTQRLAPVAVRGGLKFGQVGAGGWNACGKTVESVGYCWGLNDSGELGDGTNQDRHTPTLIAAPGTAGLRAAVPRVGAVRAVGDTLAHPD